MEYKLQDLFFLSKIENYINSFIYASVCVHMLVFTWVYCGPHVKVEDNLKELVLYSYHLSPRDQTQSICLGNKHLYPPRHLSGPLSLIPKNKFHILYKLK